MNQSLKGIIIVISVIFACTLLNSGCSHTRVIVDDRPTFKKAPPGPPPAKAGPPPWAPAHGYRAKHHYRYYPYSSVYFDTGRSLYFYYDGRNWQMSVSLPTWIRIDINDYVTLEMGTTKPYEYHPDVVKRYPPGLQKKNRKGHGKGKWS